MLLAEEEAQFIETVLLAAGLRNIFFAINRWNMVEESAGVEERIRNRLSPYCMIDGQDKSAVRIFRMNALGALRARTSKPPLPAMLAESNVPAFEESLRHFLAETPARLAWKPS